MNLLRALESTATLRIIFGASIDADENVAFIRRWHVSTLKPVALAAQNRVLGRTTLRTANIRWRAAKLLQRLPVKSPKAFRSLAKVAPQTLA
jgi:hypothetical protein